MFSLRPEAILLLPFVPSSHRSFYSTISSNFNAVSSLSLSCERLCFSKHTLDLKIYFESTEVISNSDGRSR